MITGLSVVTSVPHQCKILVFKKISRNKLFDINYSNIFLDSSIRVTGIKTKINKWDLTKCKSFCTEKESRNQVKRQPLEWEKTFANEGTDKRLNSKTNNSCSSISKQTTQSKSG